MNINDFVAEGLVELTERITQVTGEETPYGLGGPFGYGENFENDVFSMHRYCWCDGADCRWCEHNAPNFIHKPSGATVHWYKWIGRGMTISVGNWSNILRECMDSLNEQNQVDHEH